MHVIRIEVLLRRRVNKTIRVTLLFYAAILQEGGPPSRVLEKSDVARTRELAA
jgi:hypothetical protein